MRKWEYLVVDSHGESASIQAVLNELGGDGWRLVAVEPIADEGSWVETFYYFERELGR